jgi:hypothetical protein
VWIWIQSKSLPPGSAVSLTPLTTKKRFHSRISQQIQSHMQKGFNPWVRTRWSCLMKKPEVENQDGEKKFCNSENTCFFVSLICHAVLLKCSVWIRIRIFIWMRFGLESSKKFRFFSDSYSDLDLQHCNILVEPAVAA